ncbi:MAG: hypothetical protein E7214_15570 [Clostridium sp.]|nr:hypothetical protein [Clostridium sp.]
MQKNGFMLIEVLVTLTIVLTLLVIGVGGIKTYKSYMKSVKSRDFVYEINEFFDYAKVYCAKRRKNGSIVIANKGDKIELDFYSEDKLNKKCNIGCGFNLDIFFNNKIVDKVYEKVQDNGYIEANSIYFIKGEKVKYKLVIRPAANLIKVEEK